MACKEDMLITLFKSQISTFQSTVLNILSDLMKTSVVIEENTVKTIIPDPEKFEYCFINEKLVDDSVPLFDYLFFYNDTSQRDGMTKEDKKSMMEKVSHTDIE